MPDDGVEGDGSGLEVPKPPEGIRREAHVAGNGELLWPQAAAVEAARWIAGTDMAIWGGEVYAPRGPFTALMVGEWRTDPQHGPDEPWHEYVERGLAQALQAIEADTTTGDRVRRTSDTGGGRLYFLAYHPESGFPEDRKTQMPAGELRMKTAEGT